MPIRVVVYQFLPSGAKRKVLMEDFMTVDDAKAIDKLKEFIKKLRV